MTMDKRTALPKNNDIIFRTVIFAAMCLLSLIGITTALTHNIFRDEYILSVNIIIITALIFLTLLSGYVFFRMEKETSAMRYFAVFLINIHLGVFFGALAFSLYQTPNHIREITILLSLAYFFIMSMFLTLWLYLKQFLKENVLTRVVTVLIGTALVFYAGTLIINFFKPFLFAINEAGVLSDSVIDYVSIATDFFCLLLLCVATLFSDLNANQKFSFLSCIFVPVLFTILYANQNVFKWSIDVWGIFILAIVLPLCMIFFKSHDELENEALRYENEQTQLRISAMISQMQPHFLYNSLAVIEALCEEDPKLAAEATNAFSTYLRENMNFADKASPIAFSEELNHIKTYVWLEKLRFPNKLHIEYDIRCTAFYVPALSVQPMVENAIKHGICKSKSGGTVILSAFETEQFYTVIVRDDGIGFDVQKAMDDSAQHLGIKNTRYRVQKMMSGTLDIKSAPDEGTTVTITIPK